MSDTSDVPGAPETFSRLEIRIVADDDVALWYARLLMQQPTAFDLAPAAAAATLRNLADRLDDLAKAEALGLTREVALQFAGLKRDSSRGES